MQDRTSVVHLTRAGTSVVIEVRNEGLPNFLYWGPSLGDPDSLELHALATASDLQRVSGGLDITPRVTLLPMESSGWPWNPGLIGSRSGHDFSPAFVLRTLDMSDFAATIVADDEESDLSITIELSIDGTGVVAQELRLTNQGLIPYELQSLSATFPLPDFADEILDTVGRHLKERGPQRHKFTIGSHVRESRRGRPGSDGTLLLVAGRAGFGFERGLAFGVHLAWSGNYRIIAERTIAGHAVLQVAELLAAGEVILEPGAVYSTPVALGSWGEGLTALSARFHERLRARPHHPVRPRLVTVNTWEAVYFDQQHARLLELATSAASIGVERFVLDDGWFRGRRNDAAGLGDWFIDETIWPDGLEPFISEVGQLGMEFGIWVEPEMVNMDSDLARAHPDWILRAGKREPVLGRQQQVLDLSNPRVSDYLFDRLDELLSRHNIVYLKWDHNRDLVDAGSTLTQRPAVHDNIVSLYSLLGLLKQKHPKVEIESCASGGGRVDLGILEYTERIWTSDCIDPLERMTIQKYTNLLVPYELMGAHIGSPRSESTGRIHSLGFRAGTALFGHLGIEWDITRVTEDERQELATWIQLYKANRGWMHTGRSVFADLPDSSMDLRGIVSADGGRALFTFSQLASSSTYPPGVLRFPGLADDDHYVVRLVGATATQETPGQSPLAWTCEELQFSGRLLRLIGLRAPVLYPEQLTVIELLKVGQPN